MLMQVINGQCNPIEVIGGGRAKQKDNAMPQRLEWSFSEVAAMMIHLHNHILLLHIFLYYYPSAHLRSNLWRSCSISMYV